MDKYIPVISHINARPSESATSSDVGVNEEITQVFWSAKVVALCRPVM